jgi:tripartite-type tricarboxylate transporter receptor subunit TctC
MPSRNHGGRRTVLIAAAGLVAESLLPFDARAQSAWPNRPIRLVVPYAAGGGTDVIARTIATRLSEPLGQPIVVDNKPGGGGTIGIDAVAKAPADGNTLLFMTTAFATIASTGRKLPYDPVKDFVPVGGIGSTPLLIVVAQNSPIKTLRELVDQARTKPNSLTYASSGIGSMSHLGMELLNSVAKVQMLHVPYKGMAPALSDLIGGEVETALCTFASAASLMKAGKIRGLVVTGTQRSPFAANLPTSAEAGFPDFQIDFWWGIIAPARTSPAIVKRLNDELNAILLKPQMRDLLASEAAVPTPGPPDYFAKVVASDITRWTKLIKEANIQVE